MTEIEIEIDGKKLTAKPNQTVIQVADDAGIYIPRFCYHKHLSIPANCRMCLVEVEKAPKVMPACATPVMPGMKVFTKSERTIAAQRAVMEFLLINHPLDCPICDQGGECELQDLSMGYGGGWSHYDETKRSVPDQNLGPLIATDMTRCIYCTRCVRFGDEHGGLRELGLIGRGEFTEVSTYIQHMVASEISGNIIDLCPVGALTSKPYRFTARPWELDQAGSISPHDGLGTNINVHTRYGEVMRVVSRENPEINETWLADRDRFSYPALYHEDRLTTPLAKINGNWQPVDWEQALYLAAKGLQEISKADPTQIGALASPSATLEELYLLQKLVRSLGSPHIDCRLQEVDVSDQDYFPAFPGMSISLAELESCDAILFIGSHIQKEQPLLALRLRKAFNHGAAIVAINSYDYAFSFDLAAKKILAPHLLPAFLKTCYKGAKEGHPEDEVKVLLDVFKAKKKIVILLGAEALQHPEASTIRYFAQNLAEHFQAHTGWFGTGANVAGGWIAGAVPHRLPNGRVAKPGFSTLQMLQARLESYILLNLEPELDTANPSMALAAMQNAKFIVSLSTFKHPSLLEHAHVLLPLAAFTETAGTYVNFMGKWQSFQGVAKSFHDARPGWKILRALANFLNLEGFQFESAPQIRDELKVHAVRDQGSVKLPPPSEKARPISGLSRIGDMPLYAIDPIVRRSKPLQVAQERIMGDLMCVRLHPDTAKKLGFEKGEMVLAKQGSTHARLKMLLDSRVAHDAVYLASGLQELPLGELFGDIVLERLKG